MTSRQDTTPTPDQRAADIEAANTTDSRQTVIDIAEQMGIDLTPGDLQRDDDGALLIDGMAPGDWLDAMTMD